MEKDKTVQMYNKRASSYEERWSAYLKHTHTQFLEHAKLDEAKVILDLSGGTGLLAQALIDEKYRFEKLVINDPSSEMLAIARNRLPEQSKVSFSNQPAEKIEYGESTFDVIFCLNSFHFYRNQQAVLDRCYHMLKPGGQLLVQDWNRSGLFRFINFIISLNTQEHIDTKSLAEFDNMLVQSGFIISETKTWHWRYWNFFFVTAVKSVT